MANRREKGKTVTDFIFLGSKITVDGDCSHEIKRHLLLGRKVMTNLDSIFRSRDITLPTKVRLVKAMVFPIVMYGYESWTVKNAEHRRIDAFELWYWRQYHKAARPCDTRWPGPDDPPLTSNLTLLFTVCFTCESLRYLFSPVQP